MKFSMNFMAYDSGEIALVRGRSGERFAEAFAKRSVQDDGPSLTATNGSREQCEAVNRNG